MCPQHVIRSHNQARVVVPSVCPQHPIKSHNQATVVVASMCPQHTIKSHNQATVVIPSMCPQHAIKSHCQKKINSLCPLHATQSHDQFDSVTAGVFQSASHLNPKRSPPPLLNPRPLPAPLTTHGNAWPRPAHQGAAQPACVSLTLCRTRCTRNAA